MTEPKSTDIAEIGSVQTKTDKDKTIQLIRDFLDTIGIELLEEKIEGSTFLPGLDIRQGKLVFDRSLLLYPGDLLHEAGHIAVCPAKERLLLQSNVAADHPEKAGEEMAVLLWSYAAARAIGIDPEIVFHKDGYKGESEWILNNFSSGNYLGLPLLVWMGLAKDQFQQDGFPNMLKWLRD